MDLDRMIAEVEAAIQDYYLGRTVRRVKIEGEESEFVTPSIDKLEAYLAQLQARKAGQSQSGAFGFVF